MGLKIIGLALVDILPTLFQWQLGVEASAQAVFGDFSGNIGLPPVGQSVSYISNILEYAAAGHIRALAC